ncbi:hypothetical protein FOMPIDRAFT_1056129, partial [Fomitopsis schrenkii]
MSSLHPSIKYLLSTYLPTFEQVCKHQTVCDSNYTVRHVTVVRLSCDGFGRIFRYCPEQTSGHTLMAEVCDFQINEDFLPRVKAAIPQDEMPQWENRHILLGSIPEWNRSL